MSTEMYLYVALFYFQKRGSEIVEKYQQAEKDYMDGMKYKDIAEKYGTTMNTVKSWKKRYGWDRKNGAPKTKKVCTQNNKVQPINASQIDDGTKDTLKNEELTPEQQMFCIYYSRTFNATQSYLNSYGCRYSTALTNGPALLKNTRIKLEIERLKEIKRQQIVASEDDIVELQMRIAFADISNTVSFGRVDIEDGDETVTVNTVKLKESDQTDTQIIKKVSDGRNGVTVELEDRQKAIDWLTKYFLMHPDDRYKAEFDKKRAEVSDNSAETILKNIQTLADILGKPNANRSIENYE